MSFKRKLFKGQTSEKSSPNEINLRSEFDKLVFGAGGGTPHKKRVLIRKFRLDDGIKKQCVCLSGLTREASLECPFCLGEGYYWDEKWSDCYSNYLGADAGQGNRKRNLAPGVIRVDYKIFYFRFDEEIKYTDKIIEVKLDIEGNPVVPYIREAIYNPQTIVENRADNGRLEYYTIYAREQDAIARDP